MKTTFLSALGGLLILLIMETAGALACTVCYPMPATTLADRVIDSEVLVAVREKAGEPYTFHVIRSLKGEAAPEDIHIFIDAASRQRLAAEPDDVVILSRDGDADYRFFAYGTPHLQRLIDTTLENSIHWQSTSGREERYRYFLDFLGDPDPVIREQAYLEVSRAPYRLLKNFAADVDRQTIHTFLANWRYAEWHQLYILLLAQSTHQDDRDTIAREFHGLAKHGLTTNLAAWTTAFIESQSLDPEHTEGAIARVTELYFARGDRSCQEIEEVLRGVSVLGGGEDTPPTDRETREKTNTLRRSLVAGYKLLLENHPASAGDVARHLANWRVNALTVQLRAINEEGVNIDEGSRVALQSYLAMSSGFAQLTP